MRRTIVSLLLIVVAVTGCAHVAEPDAAGKARDAAALAEVLPVLEELGVTHWRDQDWCTDFVDRAGHFLRSDEPDNCNPLGDAVSAFSDEATADFDRIRSALVASGVSVVEVYRPSADPRTTIFDLRAGAFDRFSYVHDPGYQPQENLENEWVATPIDEDWYFVWEDWN